MLKVLRTCFLMQHWDFCERDVHAVSRLKFCWPITLGYLFSGALMEEEAVHKSGAGHRHLGGHHP